MSPSKSQLILDREAPLLRQTALEVPVEDIKAGKLAPILKKMQKALDQEEDGVAIAAPQIGESLRIFMVSSKVKKLTAKDPEANVDDKPLVFINPKLTKLSKGKKKMEEGCLSVRWLYGLVERSEQATIEPT
jgi:peptide deformylase